MANRVMSAPGFVRASHQHVAEIAPPQRTAVSHVPCTRGEAERDREVGDEQQREDAVGAAADLVQGLFGGWGHHPIRRRIGGCA